jgi:mono/diheme cytochrome c family protein
MMRAGRAAAGGALILALSAVTLVGAADSPYGRAFYDPAEANFPGVTDMRRAWQNWTLNCQGCHRADGSGTAGTAPPIRGTVARFLQVPGGREYLAEVPGVAAAPFSDEEIAEVMNWMVRRYDAAHVPAGFEPYTAAEVARLRLTPLGLDANALRAKLLAQAQRRLR